MLWLVVVGVATSSLAAVLIDVPTATLVLAALCAVLAVVRWTARRPPETFRARSTPFDVTVLVVAAVALAVLSPAGNLV
ncbi:hypothetical protein [Georgenia wutianyii]|uniref:hypothetical protein n=1 Tax=Georgenia wutianyii TaxID=2585135 RepID=UPI00143D6127|nr:hypothetical protein [Georgenia wutianyii]